MTSWCLGGPTAALVTSLALLLGAAPALGAGPKHDRPWATGVSTDDQREAEALFRAGVEMVKASLFARGAAHLRASAALWGHPATHFNLAQALAQAGQPAAALEHLWRTMRYGGDPLRAGIIEQARREHDLLFSTEVAHVVVRVSDPGVRVTLDGAPVIDGPGTRDLLLASAATGTLVATVDGVEVARVERRFVPGKTTDVAFTRAAGATPVVGERARSASDMRSLERAIVGFEVPWPTAAQLAAMRAEEARLGREIAAAAPVDEHLTGPAATICRGATKGDVATVCRELEALHSEIVNRRRQAEHARIAAERRLQELTRGGLVEGLD